MRLIYSIRKRIHSKPFFLFRVVFWTSFVFSPFLSWAACYAECRTVDGFVYTDGVRDSSLFHVTKSCRITVIDTFAIVRPVDLRSSMFPFSSLGSFSTTSCEGPSSLQVSNLGLSSAQVSWNTTGLLGLPMNYRMHQLARPLLVTGQLWRV